MQLTIRQGRRYRAAHRNEILEVAAGYFVAEQEGKACAAPSDAVHVVRLLCAARDHETFAVLFLDNRHRLIAAEALFRGTIDGATVYPREVRGGPVFLDSFRGRDKWNPAV